MKRTLIFMFFVLAALLWGETVINGSRSILGAWNAGGATSTIPAKVGTTLPSTCSVGEQFFKSDAEAGQNIHLCTAANTWTQVSAGGGGGGGDQVCAPGDMRYVCVADDFFGNSATAGQVGALGWWFTSGTLSLQTAAGPHYGVYRITTGSTSGNSGIVALNNTVHAFGNAYADTTKVWEAKYVFRLGQSSDIGFRVGLGQNASSWSLVGVGVGLAPSSTNFGMVAGAGGSEVSTVSFGVPIDTNWHTFTIYTDGTAQKVYAKIDSAAPLTVCPSGCSITVASGSSFWTATTAGTPWWYVRTDTSAARHIDIDYFSFKAAHGTSEAAR